MGTGDASGTWGNTTNTNLELIGEALAFGTEAITTNADTHATTVADGATDAGRAIFLKYTGTLDSACTITIGPDTIKRVQYIHNGTSGSQNILIKQGSGGGASVTIPAGTTKLVSLDGGGSGAIVTDVLAGGMNSGGLTYPSSDGSTGQFMKTDGSGVLSFATVDTTTKLDDIALGDAASTLATSAGNITIDAQGNDTDIIFKGTDATADITMLTLDGSEAGDATFNRNANFPDSGKAQFGAGQDLQIYHDASNSIIADAGTGQLQLLSNGFRVKNAAGDESMINADENGAVTLHYDNSAKVATIVM